ncbi:MAG: CinA family nicotinamide mononucleotide deamidase-related protein [Myxococcales bacterium]|jgi:nicotinamide-nucleotide amidase
MRIELLCTGNELLDGSVLDTNAAYLAEKTFALGVPVARKETLPDDLPALADALRAMGERADFVVVSGGLGPTPDDLTLEAAALAAGVKLETDPSIVAHLKALFARRGFRFTPNNERQARVPRGGQAILNPFGTAPMVTLRIGRADCFLLPGVPREFRSLFDLEVLPRLEARLAAEPNRVHRAARTLKVFGIGESMLDNAVAELPAKHPHVYFGYRTHAPENHLKLIAEGSTAEEAKARLAAAEADVRPILGDRLFGADKEEMPALVVAALKEAGATVALAESCTGGLCASLIASVPGASEVLVSSAVVYQEKAKTQLLGVSAELVAREGAVSAPVTRALAQAAREKVGSTFGLAITGWAGPGGGTESDPVGTVYVCLADGRTAIERRQVYPFDRERVRLFAAFQALDLLRLNARGIQK